jgi:hypothetical protein
MEGSVEYKGSKLDDISASEDAEVVVIRGSGRVI